MEIVELGKTGIKVQKLGLGAGPFGSIYGETNEKECGETLNKGYYSENKRMKIVELGKTGLKVQQLGLGASPFGSCYGGVSTDDYEATLKNALEHGPLYIDTAPWYGQGKSEAMLGKFLPDIPREKFVIATKVARYETDPKKMFDFSHDRALASVDESLKLLGLDYVDIIQVHDCEFAPNIDIILKETLPALEKVKKAGKAKFIGVTGYPLAVLDEIIKKSTVKIDLVLGYTRGSMANQDLSKYLPDWKDRGIAVVNASPIAMGLFRKDGPQPWHPAQDELKEEIKACIDLCNAENIDISRLALRYSLDEIDGDIVLCGTARPSELEENIKNATSPLTPTEKKMLDKIMERLSKFSGHWEGRELEAFRNRINDVEDDLPFFR